MNINYTRLNADINMFPQVFPIEDGMSLEFDGVSRLIMLDRYAFTDTEKRTLKEGDFVVLTITPDPKFPARGLGFVTKIDANKVTVAVDEQYQAQAGGEEVTVHIDAVDKPLEVFYEQIAKRVAFGLAQAEQDVERRPEVFKDFYEQIVSLNFVPAGRVLYGAGSGQDVTFFNCFVMPMPKDSREGIGEHRNEVMEIMSRGGGRLIAC